jgi:hypothetical protein
MAKIVSDNLVIKIARKGKEKIHDLGGLFNENPNRFLPSPSLAAARIRKIIGHRGGPVG